MKENINSGKIDEKKLNDFMLKAIEDIASTISAMLVIIGIDLICSNPWRI
jgi:hypothetical protein